MLTDGSVPNQSTNIPFLNWKDKSIIHRNRSKIVLFKNESILTRVEIHCILSERLNVKKNTDSNTQD